MLSDAAIVFGDIACSLITTSKIYKFEIYFFYINLRTDIKSLMKMTFFLSAMLNFPVRVIYPKEIISFFVLI